jgi:hypothetical protein
MTAVKPGVEELAVVLVVPQALIPAELPLCFVADAIAQMPVPLKRELAGLQMLLLREE